MSRKWITALKQLNKVQYISDGTDKKIPLLTKPIDIESLKDLENDELQDIFFRTLDPIRDTHEEYIPKKLIDMYWVIHEKRNLSELSSDGSGTGFIPEQQTNCPVCGKELVNAYIKRFICRDLCSHVLLIEASSYCDGSSFYFIDKSMKDIADKLIAKMHEEENYSHRALNEHMKEYAEHSNGQYALIKIIDYRRNDDYYFLIKFNG